MTQIQSLTQNTTPQDASASAIMNSSTALGQENTFLQLLVAQIQNQDPTQPMDSTAFMTQLAQFSSLEQLIGIRQTVEQLVPATTTSSSGATNGTQNT
jgi:flagellar basal-body rod modification protein FlgD